MALEILAPVGGREQLIAAVRSGANAVYLGARNFNARRNAENFENDSLLDTVRYCHSHGVKVHVTLNTLVRDDEMPRLLDTLDEIAASGADAVIVQDVGIMSLIRSRYPSLAIHASTQCVVHNSEGAKFYENLGLSRVVLARELSLEEIRTIRKNTKIELEAFVHGALCMSISGGCYLSSVIGGRSGNRGLCAQPCRLDFRLGCKDHVLSLKDMSHIRHIRALAEAGVCSFKIEGRMKRPEYVAAAVTACRKALDGERYDADTLRAVFSRSGFTDGYLRGVRDREMFGYRGKEDVTAAQSVFDSLQQLYHRENALLPVTMQLRIRPDTSELTAVCGDAAVRANGSGGIPAEKRPTDVEQAAKFLTKSGGTQFYVSEVQVQNENNLMLPPSAMNALRRDALTQLDALLAATEPHRNSGELPAPISCYTAPEAPQLWARFADITQLASADAFERIILPAKQILQNEQQIAPYADRIAAELPVLLFPENEQELPAMLQQLKTRGIHTVFAENIYALQAARSAGFAVVGGAYLNIMNSRALEFYKNAGLSAATVSFELTMSDIDRLQSDLPRGYIAYGRLPVMRMRSCPARAAVGCGSCNGCSELTDRKDAHFPLICEEKRYATLLNSVPLHIADKAQAKADFLLLYFTTETASQCSRTAQEINQGLAADYPRTGGLYYRGVQ